MEEVEVDRSHYAKLLFKRSSSVGGDKSKCHSATQFEVGANLNFDTPEMFLRLLVMPLMSVSYDLSSYRQFDIKPGENGDWGECSLYSVSLDEDTEGRE